MKSPSLARSTVVASLAAATVGFAACSGPAQAATTPSPQPQRSSVGTYPMEASGRYFAAGTIPHDVHAHPSLAGRHLATRRFDGALVDLAPTVADPIDGATARLNMGTSSRGSVFTLHVRGIAAAGVGHSFGAHLHLGPCVAGQPAAALGHYNTSALAGSVPPVVSDQTEVWLDFTVSPDGSGDATAVVPFVPVPGNRAVVIHAEHTDPATGAAGSRLACLPVQW
jgi:hypothetical protein